METPCVTTILMGYNRVKRLHHRDIEAICSLFSESSHNIHEMESMISNLTGGDDVVIMEDPDSSCCFINSDSNSAKALTSSALSLEMDRI